MKRISVWRTVAITSTLALLVSACNSDSNGSDNDENGNGHDGEGIPAADMADWDVDCDWFFLDDLQDFLGYESYAGDEYIESPYGAGTSLNALTCTGMVEWPEYEAPDGRTQFEDATFYYHAYPADDSDMADEHYQERLEHDRNFNSQHELVADGELDGQWSQSIYEIYEEDHADAYFALIQDDDFTLEFHIRIPTPSLEIWDESDLVQGEWDGYDFDREGAIEFLVEEQMPKIHGQFLTLLERNG